MERSTKLFLLTLLVSMTCLGMARPLNPDSSNLSLATRLQSDNNTVCWDSLLELRACTGEVILFFLNGETYLGPDCCRAIRFIEHQCWPAMLGSIGFTPEESGILRGYCDATGETTAPPPPPSSPTPPPSPPGSNSTPLMSMDDFTP
ncbi:egg cell-secreted protein 1.4-like [Macadamia integrifolia]|uniref:egg cell-secreted protein 1.4-like n=1 Tax=Macadamia integrifolia TaxID=60698 RepID=UPI001C4F2514|nr:egg cell-secreted protein 1.4-like [Macadamia integrifolia]